MLGLMNYNYPVVGIGAGIALYGITYFLIHDVLIHRRFKRFDKTNSRYFGAIRKAHKYVIITFLISLIPFLFINGVLTGSGISEQIVWYNEAQFSSIQFSTIPIEDIIYSYCPVGLNILVYENLKSKISIKS